VQPRLHQLALAVASDHDGAVAEHAHRIDGLARERPASHVAADDDQVDSEILDLRQHGGQGSIVAMDVIEGGDAHRRQRRSSFLALASPDAYR
jgi:hypothetical protein